MQRISEGSPAELRRRAILRNLTDARWLCLPDPRYVRSGGDKTGTVGVEKGDGLSRHDMSQSSSSYSTVCVCLRPKHLRCVNLTVNLIGCKECVTDRCKSLSTV